MIVLARPDLDAGAVLDELQRISSADAVARYEEALRGLLGAQEVHAVDSARAAIVLALRASAVKGRDEVIVPSFICPAVIDAIHAAGATAVLADSDPGTPNVSAAQVAQLAGEKTRAVIVPHVYGVRAPVAQIAAIAQNAGAVVIEDCAHTVSGGKAGTFAVFSTNFDKPFTTGYGGVLAVNDARYRPAMDAGFDAEQEEDHLFGLLLDLTLSRSDLYRRGISTGQGRLWLKVPHIRALYRRFRDGRMSEGDLRAAAQQLIEMHPLRKSLAERVLTRLGIRGAAKIPQRRMGPRRAMLGLATLAAFPETQAKRQRNAALYASLLAGSSNVALIPSDDQWLRYAVLARDSAIAKTITARAAEAGYRIGNANWPAAIHQLARYRRKVRFGALPNAESFAARVINLPLHGEITEADVRKLAEIIHA